MKKSDAFPDRSSFLSKEDVDPPRIATIAGVTQKTFEDDDGEKRKPVVSFHEPDLKPMVLNVTNWDTIESMFGDDSDLWPNKKIEVYHDPTVMNKGKRVGGVRVRKPAETLTPANPPFENFAAALEYIQAHNCNVDEFKDFLKAHELTKFSGQRDSGLVYEFVNDASAEAVF